MKIDKMCYLACHWWVE